MQRERLLTIALLLIAYATRILGAPTISLPVNAQVPPLARVSEEFQYQFADTTFTSQNPTSLVYSLGGAPSWLQLDSSTRTFSGKPNSQDLGPFNFQLNAADSTGAVGMQVTFMVVNSPKPHVGIDLISQLEKFGGLSQSTSLEYYSNEAFNVALTPAVFQNAGNVSYYATSTNGSPLPSWLKFDSGSVTLSGLTPTPVNSPEIFGVSLSVSSIPGFADASIQLSFVVSDHELLFFPYEQTIKVSGGRPLSFPSLESQLLLDGEQINGSQIRSSSALTPPWMQYNPQTLSLSGQPPPGINSEDVTVSVNDVFGDTASALLHFHFQSLVFAGEIGVLDARIGSSFTYQINRSIFTNPDVKVTVNLGPTSSWLKFYTSDLTLRGTVPQTLKPTEEQLSITATLPSSSTTESQIFHIRILPSQSPDATNTLLLESSPTMATPTSVQATGTSQKSTAAAQHSLTGDEIAALAVLPIIAFIILLLILFFRFRNRRNAERSWNLGTKSPHQSPSILRREKTEREGNSDVEMGGLVVPGQRSPAPQLSATIDGIGSSIRSSKYRYSNISVIIQGQVETRGNTNLNVDRNGKEGLKQAEKAGTIVVLSERDLLDASAFKRQSRKPSRSSLRNSGLPIERKLTGLGHGRSSYASQSRIFGSLRRSHGTDSSSLASYSTISIQRKIDSFPSAPRGQQSSSLRAAGSDQDKNWIRKVSEDLDETSNSSDLGISDSRPLEERRQSFIRWRASKGRSANPLFSGTSGRLKGNGGRKKRVQQRTSTSPGLVLQHINRVPRIQSGYTLSSAGASEGWETADGSSVASETEELDELSELSSERTGRDERFRKLSGRMRTLRDELEEEEAREGRQGQRPSSLVGFRRPPSVLVNRPLRSQMSPSKGPGHRFNELLGKQETNGEEGPAFI